jgi:Arc/MetJ-type ribon-helix-helix transcriptional regulator
MAKSKSAILKTTGRPAKWGNPVKTVRMSPDLSERIDRWAKRNGKDSHSEAMRHLLELGLKAPTPQEAPGPAQLSKAAINQIADRTVERSDAMQRKAGRAPKRKASK